MLNTLANELNETGKAHVNEEDIFQAVERMYERCARGLACTAMLAGSGIAAFRDRHGIRPMVLGSRPSLTLKGSTDYMVASELVALRNLDSVTLMISFLDMPCFAKEVSRLSVRLFHNSHMPLIASDT
jgi:glutamine phosphoribosylpyrophosphate amidotransferase